jgi:phage terminase Nu1 subunit (DNA packaging protein)
MRIVGQENIAAMFQVTAKTVVEWQEQGLPVAVRGGAGVPSEYDSGPCIAWHTQRELAKVQTESPRDRLARLQADEIEIRMQEKRGTLVPADQIEPMWSGMVSAARAFLRSEVNRVAQLLQTTDGVEAKRDLLSDTFDEFLTKLSGYDPGEDPADDGALTHYHPEGT